MMYIPATHMAHRHKVKLHFCLCADIPKKCDSLIRRSLSRRESPRRGSKTPNGDIEICSQDSSSDSPANVSGYLVVPDSILESMSWTRSGRAKGKTIIEGKLQTRFTLGSLDERWMKPVPLVVLTTFIMTCCCRNVTSSRRICLVPCPSESSPKQCRCYRSRRDSYSFWRH